MVADTKEAFSHGWQIISQLINLLLEAFLVGFLRGIDRLYGRRPLFEVDFFPSGTRNELAWIFIF